MSSKLKKAYLTQHNNKYESIVAVELTIKKAMSMPKPRGCDVWEIFLDMDDVWGLYKAFQKNRMFNVYVEYTATDANGKPIVETITGEIEVTDIVCAPVPTGRPHSVKGRSTNLKFSTKEKFIREKVQFD